MLLNSVGEGADAKARWAALNAAGMARDEYALSMGEPLPDSLLTTVLVRSATHHSYNHDVHAWSFLYSSSCRRSCMSLIILAGDGIG